jgi:hypothetical protein
MGRVQVGRLHRALIAGLFVAGIGAIGASVAPPAPALFDAHPTRVASLVADASAAAQIETPRLRKPTLAPVHSFTHSFDATSSFAGFFLASLVLGMALSVTGSAPARGLARVSPARGPPRAVARR